MSDNQDAELLELVRSLTDRIDHLEGEIKQLRLLHKDVPEETLVAIAAAVAAFLGHRAKKRQAQFARSGAWQSGTRKLQHVHQPLHLRQS
jgi:methylmalonyl-CoA carboxyltransferase large subunit